jgi:galactose mutarotase-like enzyme
LISQYADKCHFQLQSNDLTRSVYPFDFLLDIYFSVSSSSLNQTATVTNTSEDAMPASLGYHPGFQWPLPSTNRSRKQEHILQFSADENAPIRRPVNRLLSLATEPNPVRERILTLSDELFRPGAIVFDQLASRSVWFGVPGEPGVRLDFEMPHLGLWMIPGRNFLCIEPWQGHACPEDFAGDILEKPGMIHLNPGDSFSRTMTITVNASDQSFQ